MARTLGATAAVGSASWQMLTVLDPVAAAYGSLSMDGLRVLLKAGVDIRHVDGLHAKVFLVDGTMGWAGSANLTGPGLGLAARPNLELTVPLAAAQVADATSVLSGWWHLGVPVTAAMLNDCEKRARRVPVRFPTPPTAGAAAKIKAEAADDVLEDAATVQVWVKAMYRDAAQADHQWEDGDFVTSSKRGRPSFALGDLLLTYATYAGVCNAVLEVTGVGYEDPLVQARAGIPAKDAERWPWINHVKPRLQVRAAEGVALEELGLTGQSLQGGHCRMPIGGLPAAVRQMLR